MSLSTIYRANFVISVKGKQAQVRTAFFVHLIWEEPYHVTLKIVCFFMDGRICEQKWNPTCLTMCTQLEN